MSPVSPLQSSRIEYNLDSVQDDSISVEVAMCPNS